MPGIFQKTNAAITLGGLTLASIAQTCQGEPQLAVVAGVLGYLASVSSDHAHACYNSFVENQSPGADEVFRNHHLQGLVESAVHSTMLLAVQYSPADAESEDFQNALATFPKYIANSAQKSDSQLAQLGSFDLPDFLKNFVAKEGKAEFLSAREWEALLESETLLPSSLRSAVALTLHQKFPEGLWNHVKISAEKDAQAFAAVELLYLSRILEAVEGKPDAPDVSALEARTEELYAQLADSQRQWFERLWEQAERHHEDDMAAHRKSHRYQRLILRKLHRIEEDRNAPGSLLSLHQLPPAPPEFRGRDEELQGLEAALNANGAAGATISARQAGLQGMGGVGKTALAIVLAHRLKERYPHAQLFLNLRGADPQRRAPMTPQQAMQEIIHLFRPTAQLPDDLEALQREYHGVLNQAGRVLLLLDNAAGAEQVRPLVPPADCLLLVTSRTQFSLPGLVARNLDCLEPHESEALLGRLAPRLNEHAHEAADLLGHLPLALEVFAGAANASRLLPPAQLVERLRQKQERLDAVNAAFQISAELLDADLRRRWMQLAVFPASFTLQAAAALWGSEEEATRLALEELLNASLLEYNENVGRFRLHDLIRQFCDAQLSAAEKYDIQKRHALYYLQVLSGANGLFLKGHEAVLPGLTLFDDERTHIEAGQSWAATHAVQDEEAARLCMNYPNAGAYVLELRQHPRQRIEWLEDALKAARQLKERLSEGVALGNLGLAYYSLGEVRRAIEYHEQDLEIAREIGDRGGQGVALGNLGNAYYYLGEARRAIEYHEQALAVSREIGDRRSEGNALGNLGVAYVELGEVWRAIEYYEQILIIHREIGDRAAEGQDLGNLGVAYAALGEVRQATEYYEQRLEIAKEIGDRRGEGYALWNMSLALDELCERARAISLAEAALKIFEQIEDPKAAEVRAKLEKWRGEAAGNGN
jgi:tetratricopeptide (TPR) repeat protein